MPIQISPSVVVQEKDLTNVIPAVSSSVGAAVIDAAWGPVMDVTAIDSENVLVQRFGKPNSANAQSWFTLANFLAYSGNALAVRTDTTGQRNAVATLTGSITNIAVGTAGSGYTDATVTIGAPNISGGIQATATATIGALGAITAITVTNAGTGYSSAPSVSITGTGGTSATATATVAQGGVKINNLEDYTDKFINGEGVVGEFAARYPGSLGNSLLVSMADAASYATWTYKSLFGIAPGTSEFAANKTATGDEMHIVVVDSLGTWTGTPNTVLEQFQFVSKAGDARKPDGTSAYYKNVLNNRSSYVYWMDHVTAGTNWGNDATASLAYASIGATAITRQLVGGANDFASTNGQKQNAFALFQNDEAYDISLVMCGGGDRDVAAWVINNVTEVRKDCVAFVSPKNVTSGDPIIGNNSDAVEEIIKFKNGDGSTVVSLPSSSYAVFDTGYKYQYDRYNDTYRWVPLNGDVAGLCARTDYTDDPWFSPAGLNRGQIKNVVKLGYSPSKADRDKLYLAGINPVVSFPGQGVVLYGDKTGLAKPSAFDRINVRRLFIVLEKAIATAAKYQLFEFNDAFTRATFRNMVEPYLRDVKGRRGVYDFKVVCDESNNTGEVIDGNRFVADIYIKPARSISFIQLNFIATRTSASFEEIAGGVV